MHDIFNIESNHNASVQQLAEMGYKITRTPDSAVQKSRSKDRSREQAQKKFYADIAVHNPDDDTV